MSPAIVLNPSPAAGPARREDERPDTIAGRRSQTVLIRYRFGDFTLSPRRRVLLRDGREVPLIPRYFDLLVLLVERRHEAVHRRDIFERVWTDVSVSDSALSQAVRTLRSTLGDDSREPRFIRTVARHGYQFVFADVVEEEDEGVRPEPVTVSPPQPVELPQAVEVPPLHSLETLHDRTSADAPDRHLAPAELRQLHQRRATRIAARRWAGAAAGGGVAGVMAGTAGGLILAAAPGSVATVAIAPVLGVIGGACGALGGAGVGAGLSFAEARARSRRALVLISAAALGGGVVGAAVQWLARWGLAGLVGLDVGVGGGLEGIVIGAAAGAGYAIATPDAAAEIPAAGERGRVRAALITAAICGLAGVALTLAGRPLVGGTIHAIAAAAHGSRATLAPLGRLIGEPDFGPVSGALLAFGEGAVFGLGIAYGLMRRLPGAAEPVSPRS